jgi:hypothetical protein
MQTTKLEQCIDKELSFDEIASVAVYLYADVKYFPPAKRAIEKAKQKCPTELTAEELETEVGWDGLYNKRVEELATQHGYKTWVDRWGAYCWTDNLGNHCGDQSNFYPLYLHEETLKKDLERGKIPEPISPV